MLAPSSAQEPTRLLQEIKETEFDDEIPKHVPLKIKIKKEKEAAFKDLKNERWARDFELEVTNIGDKPIYSLSLLLVTDLRAAAGFRIVAPLQYGMLGKVTDKASPEDVPIKPGETYVFKIHPGQLDAWDTIQLKEPCKIFGIHRRYLDSAAPLLLRNLNPLHAQLLRTIHRNQCLEYN